MLIAVSGDSRSLDDIIKDAWESHQQKVADGVYSSAPGAESSSQIRAHKCVHDELMQEPSRKGLIHLAPPPPSSPICTSALR